jgi:murein DD-endopeptidase MepM/ murein hydrolase activator NlpD
MDAKLIWSAAILLPIMASCAAPVGLVKKSDESRPTFQLASHVETKETSNQPKVEQGDGAFHIVGPDESLKHICNVYGLDIKKVAKINRILPPYNVKEGDSIFLPALALLSNHELSNETRKARAAESGICKATRETVTCALQGKRDPSVPELKFPVPGGTLTSPFGYRWGRLHKGLDIAAPVGKAVLACADGRVAFVGSRKKFRRYGNTILLDHGKGVYTYYAHLSDTLIKRGQQIKRGQKIGLVGNSGRSTGPHLHLEVRCANTMYNPLAYLCPKEVAGTLMVKRFNQPPMGPVRAGWRVPDLLSANQ